MIVITGFSLNSMYLHYVCLLFCRKDLILFGRAEKFIVELCALVQCVCVVCMCVCVRACVCVHVRVEPVVGGSDS